MTVEIEEIFRVTPAVPVLTIRRIEQAIPLARAIRAGGLRVLEVALRTPVALAAISEIREEFADLTIGAGTIASESDVESALGAGVDFLTSPGFTPSVLDASERVSMPFLPGIATISEVITLLDRGITHMKFFPAEVSGGISMLDSIFRPFPQVFFCPAGGIDHAMASDYLGLANVFCVSGSWVAPDVLVEAENWRQIEANAREASALRLYQ